MFSLYFQYCFVPALFSLNDSNWSYILQHFPGLGPMLRSAWLRGYCSETFGYGSILHQRCVGNVGAYRPTLIAFLFFAFTAIRSITRNRISTSWKFSYTLYFTFVFCSIFIPNEPLFNGWGYYVLFRFGAMCFIILQQIILIDIAYKWNEAWLDRANHSDIVEWGTGIKWLRAIVTVCIIFYSATIAGIIFIYQYFGKSGCVENQLFISLTVSSIIFVTALQLYTTEGSLLTSSIISSYVTYLAYSAVSKNPRVDCNPSLGNSDTLGVVLGLSLTMISLAWTGYSWTANERLLSSQGTSQSANIGQIEPLHTSNEDETLDLNEPLLQGVAIDLNRPNPQRGESSFDCKMNIILCIITCWVAASLTCWGTIGMNESDSFSAANPQVGRINMFMIGFSQLVAILLYCWTLVAPRLYPDYDFS